jgi:tRNA threonylcarbamoyladenosine biosynthesis protein TsaE
LSIGLVGTLGAGKTRFCQELASAFGLAAEDVTSPTFTLIRSYDVANSKRVWPRYWHHLDLYRIGDEDELWELGIEELWEQTDAWTIMEWADRFADVMPDQTLWIEFVVPEQGPPDTRQIRCYCQDPNIGDWLRSVAERMTV